MLVIRKELKAGLGISAAVLGVAAVYGLMSMLGNGGVNKSSDPSLAQSGTPIETLNIDSGAPAPAPVGLESAMPGLPPKEDAVVEPAVQKINPAGQTPVAIKEDPFAESGRTDGSNNDDKWTLALNTGRVSTETQPGLIRTSTPTALRTDEPLVQFRNDTSATPPLAPDALVATGTYVIQPGDNYSRIANKIYGNSKYYTVIEKANPDISPTKLRPNMTIKVPPLDSSMATIRGSISAESEIVGTIDTSREYRVVAGDTLHRIASRLYKKSAMWQAIYDLNKQTIGPDAGRLKVGTVLILPETPKF